MEEIKVSSEWLTKMTKRYGGMEKFCLEEGIKPIEIKKIIDRESVKVECWQKILSGLERRNRTKGTLFLRKIRSWYKQSTGRFLYYIFRGMNKLKIFRSKSNAIF